MNSETKVIGIIGIITIIVIGSGLYFAGKSGAGAAPKVDIKQEALIRADSPRLTGANAGETASKKVQIVEFGDLQCPACAALHPALKQLIDTYGSNIDFIFRFIPIHSHSQEAASSALAAGEQGKFFPMFDIIFDHQDDWSALGADFEKLFDSYAQTIGLDMTKYHADLAANKEKYTTLVNRDGADASAMGINSTPTLIFNGQYVTRGALSYDKLKVIYDQLLASSTGGTASTTATTTASASGATTATPSLNLNVLGGSK